MNHQAYLISQEEEKHNNTDEIRDFDISSIYAKIEELEESIYFSIEIEEIESLRNELTAAKNYLIEMNI